MSKKSTCFSPFCGWRKKRENICVMTLLFIIVLNFTCTRICRRNRPANNVFFAYSRRDIDCVSVRERSHRWKMKNKKPLSSELIHSVWQNDWVVKEEGEEEKRIRKKQARRNNRKKLLADLNDCGLMGLCSSVCVRASVWWPWIHDLVQCILASDCMYKQMRRCNALKRMN